MSGKRNINFVRPTHQCDKRDSDNQLGNTGLKKTVLVESHFKFPVEASFHNK